jgi:hypothetical protein
VCWSNVPIERFRGVQHSCAHYCSAGVVTWCLGASMVLVVGLGVVWLHGCAGPVSVDRHDMAGCGLSVGFVVVSGEVVGGVKGTPCGSPLSLSAAPLASCMPHIP